MFRIPRSAELDPVQAGIGLGCTQGIAAGLLVGLVVVLAVAWYESRTIRPGKGHGGEGEEF